MTGIPAPARFGRTIVVVTVLLLASAACGGGDPVGGTDPAGTDPPGTVTSTTSLPADTNPATTSPPTTGEGNLPSSSLVDQAVADLAARLSVDVGDVTVVSHEGVTWPDGSIGCPQPGMGYTMALVDGTRTLLEVDGVTYAYHGAGMDAPFFCEAPEPPIGE